MGGHLPPLEHSMKKAQGELEYLAAEALNVTDVYILGFLSEANDLRL